MASSSSSSFTLRSILEKEKLNETNFIDWIRNLRIVLKQERKDYVLENPIPPEPAANAPRAERDAYKKHSGDAVDATCLMLATMNSELQKQFENMMAFNIVMQLKKLFQAQARVERYEMTKALHECKMAEDASVSSHVIKMIGYIENLERLRFPYNQDLAIDIILQSLPPSYSSFIMNYNMNGLEKSLTELHGMLKIAEQNIKHRTSDVLLVQKGKKTKKKRKAKGKGHAKAESSSKDRKPKKPTATSSATCFHCHDVGHWKRNCPKYLEDKKKGSLTSTSGIYVIEVNIAKCPSNAWVLDTGAGAHICSNMQTLQGSRTLARGKVQFCVGNGARVAAIAVWTFPLTLSSGMVLELSKCYYVPAINKNIISVSCLDTETFVFSLKNKCCSFYLNDMFYGSAPLVNGLYILDLQVPINNVITKKAKINDLNPTFL